jgi:hypothetical protein
MLLLVFPFDGEVILVLLHHSVSLEGLEQLDDYPAEADKDGRSDDG